MTSQRPGLLLKRLMLLGAAKESAVIEFADGLNVISGPSDTGKTFIVQCIDFLLGARTLPKAIPEAEGYQAAALDIQSRSTGDRFRLKRALRGGAVTLQVDGQVDRVLDPQHKAGNDNTVSAFLLELSGFDRKRVRTNARGVTRDLSFRDLSHLTVIDEEAIIRQSSPVLSGHYTSGSAERSVFRLLLTGYDDSQVAAKPDAKISRGREEGKAEILETLLGRANEELSSLGIEGPPADWERELDALDAVMDDVNESLAVEQAAVGDLERRRQALWRSLRNTESRRQVVTELESRFQLLSAQYLSDLRRLEAISEAGIRLAQLPQQRCPLCGAETDQQSSEHQHPAADSEAVAKASRVEAEKVRGLMADLAETIAVSAAQASELSDAAEARRAELRDAERELKERVSPRIEEALRRARSTDVQREMYRRALDLHNRIVDLQTLSFSEPLVTRAKGENVRSNVGTDEAELFMHEVEALLREWHFPSLGRVTFSEDDQDVVISGVRRGSHGKGVRAITHAAFTVALMGYCSERGLPHPMFVILDSPLVVYREPEELKNPGEVKDAFYRSLAERTDQQVIVFENVDPPRDVSAQTNVIGFTASKHGRRGFIP